MKTIRTTALLGAVMLASSGFAAAAATHNSSIKVTPHGAAGQKAIAKIPGHHSNLIAQSKIKALLASGKISDKKSAKDGWTGTGGGADNKLVSP